jgi:hypothetical protein
VVCHSKVFTWYLAHRGCYVLLQERLVAMGGKLVTLKSQAGEAPNGEPTAAVKPLQMSSGSLLSTYSI